MGQDQPAHFQEYETMQLMVRAKIMHIPADPSNTSRDRLSIGKQTGL
jgi:hypothetical protein